MSDIHLDEVMNFLFLDTISWIFSNYISSSIIPEQSYNLFLLIEYERESSF